MSDVGLGTDPDDRSSDRPRRLGGCIAVLIAFAVLAGGIGFAVIQGRSLLDRFTSPPPPDYSGTGHGSVLIHVKRGQTAADIGATLRRKGVVKTAEAFSAAALDNQRSKFVQVGYYRLRKQMSASSALSLLLSPKARVGSTVTVPEGLRLTEIVALLDQQTRFRTKAIDEALLDVKDLGLPAYAGHRPEGYLFPATYEIQPSTTAASLVRSMVDRFKQAAATVHLEDRAKALGVTPAQAVIVASLVQSEARRPQDFAKVATVIYNRLKIGEPLGLDSTVHYAVNSSGDIFTTRAQRGVDSPYNTYTNAGLPPGPISSPGEQALEAALNPADGKWLYFVTVNLNTGETRFAVTPAQHERNRELLAQWCTAHVGRC